LLLFFDEDQIKSNKLVGIQQEVVLFGIIVLFLNMSSFRQKQRQKLQR